MLRKSLAGPCQGQRSSALSPVEALESRQLFDATGLFAASFNFGPAKEPAISGYFPDHGAVFGDRGNGLQYGWTVNETRHARLRRSKLAPDQRYDGLVAFGPGQLWELAVPDGAYQVQLVLGDPNTTSGLHEASVQGSLVSFVSTRKLRWNEWTLNVNVTDGYLKIAAPTGVRHFKSDEIDFVSVIELPAVPTTGTGPSTPTDLTLVSQTDTNVHLQWAAGVGGTTAVAGYQIYRGSILAGTVGPSITTFTDTGVAPGTTYTYTVKAADNDADVTATSNSVTVTTPGTAAAPTAPSIAGNWTLSFGDDFNTLNTNVWTNGYYWWNGNAGTQSTFTPSNVSISNGILSLSANKGAVKNTANQMTPYSSGLIQTGGIQGVTPPGFTFTYGYVEMRAKIAPGYGMWSTLWMLPVSHQDNYELDAFENLGKTPYAYQAFDHNWPNAGKSVLYGVPFDLTNSWHTYGMDWEPDHITWYLDGKAITTYADTSVIPEQAMYLIMNLDVGGNFAGKVNASTPATSSWNVDYVRVWQH